MFCAFSCITTSLNYLLFYYITFVYGCKHLFVKNTQHNRTFKLVMVCQVKTSHLGNALQVLLELAEWNMEAILVFLDRLCIFFREVQLIFLLCGISPNIIVNLRIFPPFREQFIMIHIEVMIPHMIIR